jgi:hypothetical protein
MAAAIPPGPPPITATSAGFISPSPIRLRHLPYFDSTVFSVNPWRHHCNIPVSAESLWHFSSLNIQQTETNFLFYSRGLAQSRGDLIYRNEAFKVFLD